MGSCKKIIQVKVQRDFFFFKNVLYISAWLYAVGNISSNIEKSWMQEWKCLRTV